MSVTFAFECYADQDLYEILRSECALALEKRHSYNKGEVVKDVFKSGRARVGIVDQDPGTTPPRTLGQAALVRRLGDIELRKHQSRHVLVLCPRLEECFFKGMSQAGITPEIARTPDELHRLLATGHRRRHEKFREELKRLVLESRRRNLKTFIIDLETLLKELIEG